MAGVAETMPVMLRAPHGRLTCVPIEDAFYWFMDTLEIKEGQQIVYPRRWKVWSNGGFVAIHAITRRRTEEGRSRMWRLLTHTASVDVTANQLFLKQSGDVVRTANVEKGDLLLQAYGPEAWEESSGNEDSVEWMHGYYYGAFYADGTCAVYLKKDGYKYYNLHIVKHDQAWLEKVKQCGMVAVEKDGFSNCTFKIYAENPGIGGSLPIHRLKLLGGQKTEDYVSFMRKQFYNTDKTKRVPDDVLNGSYNFQTGFVKGYYAGDGSKTGHNTGMFSTKGPVGAMELNWLMRKVGYAVTLHLPPSTSLYCMTLSFKRQNKHPWVVKKKIDMENVNCEWVYSMDTTHGVFCAGVGTLLCCGHL